jgi:hypothetical protein
VFESRRAPRCRLPYTQFHGDLIQLYATYGKSRTCFGLFRSSSERHSKNNNNNNNTLMASYDTMCNNSLKINSIKRVKKP